MGREEKRAERNKMDMEPGSPRGPVLSSASGWVLILGPLPPAAD